MWLSSCTQQWVASVWAMNGQFWLLFALSSGAIAFCSAQHHPEQLRDRWEESSPHKRGDCSWTSCLWSSFKSPSESGLLPKAAMMWVMTMASPVGTLEFLNFQTGLRSGGIFVSLVNYPRKFFCLVKLINIYKILTRREREEMNKRWVSWHVGLLGTCWGCQLPRSLQPWLISKREVWEDIAA